MTPEPFQIVIPGAPVPASRARVRGGQGGYHQPRYRQWLHDAAWVVSDACLQAYKKRPRWASPTGVLFEFYGARANSDPDNLVKAALDALVQGGVLKDDNIRNVPRGGWSCHPPGPKGEKRVVIIVTPGPDSSV